MSARATWAKFGRYMARAKRNLPKAWEPAVKRSARIIVRNMEKNEPTLKGAFAIPHTTRTKIGHEGQVRAKEGREKDIINKQWGSPGHTGRGPYPLYFKPEDRQRVIDELKAQEAEWYAKGAFKSGLADARVSAYAELKLWTEGVIIRYGPFKGATPTHFVEKSVRDSIDAIVEQFSKATMRGFK